MKTIAYLACLLILTSCGNSFKVAQPVKQSDGWTPDVSDPVVDTTNAKAYYFDGTTISQLDPLTSLATQVASYGSNGIYPQGGFSPGGYHTDGNRVDSDTTVFYFETYNTVSGNDELLEFNTTNNSLTVTDTNLNADSYSRASGNALLIHQWNSGDDHVIYTGNNAPGVNADTYYGLDGTILTTKMASFNSTGLGKGYFLKRSGGSQAETYLLLKTYPTPGYEAFVHPGTFYNLETPAYSSAGAAIKVSGSPATVLHFRYSDERLIEVLNAEIIYGPFSLLGRDYLALTLNSSTGETSAHLVNQDTGATSVIATYTTAASGSPESLLDYQWDPFILLSNTNKTIHYLIVANPWSSNNLMIFKIADGTITPHQYTKAYSDVSLFMNNDRLHALSSSGIQEIELLPGVAQNSSDMTLQNRVLSALCLNKGYPLSCDATLMGGSVQNTGREETALSHEASGLIDATLEGNSYSFNYVFKNQSLEINSTKNVYLDNFLKSTYRINKPVMSWNPVP